MSMDNFFDAMALKYFRFERDAKHGKGREKVSRRNYLYE
jgi:hypothetical protein